jgi:aspartate racemase
LSPPIIKLFYTKVNAGVKIMTLEWTISYFFQIRSFHSNISRERPLLNYKIIVLILFLNCRFLQSEEMHFEHTKNNMTAKQKTIGIIGGVSWESTALYYKLMNQFVREQLGGLNSAKILLYSLNYDPIVELERQGKWNDVGLELAYAAETLQKGGADCIILCCNTLHKMAFFIEQSVQIPFLHIADPAGNILKNNQIQKIGLLGTQFTMEEGFYASRLTDKFGLEVVVPNEEDRRLLDSIIYDELCQGKISAESKQALIRIIQDLSKQRAEAVLLACTELGLLVQGDDVEVPIYDTTLLHANEAANWSIKGLNNESCLRALPLK